MSRPIIEMVGEIPLVLPMPSDYLPVADLERMRAIEEELRRGRRAMAHRLALQLEARWKITAEDRILALAATDQVTALMDVAIAQGAAAAAQPKRLTRRERRKLPFEPIGAVECDPDGPMTLPDGERGLAEGQVEAWDRNREILTASADLLSEDQREARARAMAHIENKSRVEAEKAWRQAVLAESADLAHGRGEAVEVLSSGALRLDDRDPLIRLLRLGLITATQHDIGRECGDLYEARREGVSSQFGETGRRAHNNDRFVLTSLQKAKRLVRVEIVEVAIRCGLIRTASGSLIRVEAWGAFKEAGSVSPTKARELFRAVCCDARSLSSFSKGGRGHARNLKGLCIALDVAHEVIRG